MFIDMVHTSGIEYAILGLPTFLAYYIYKYTWKQYININFGLDR